MKRLWRRMHRGNKGFTLIELLIVVAIIGVLAAVAIPALFRFMGAGEEEAAEAELATIQTAIDAAMVAYRLTNVTAQPAPGVTDFAAPLNIRPAGDPRLPAVVPLYPEFLRTRHAGALERDGTPARYSWGPDGRVVSTALDPALPPGDPHRWR